MRFRPVNGLPIMPGAALGTLALTVAGTALNHLLASGGRGAQLLAARAAPCCCPRRWTP
nr:hypothetical protein [Deinococcus sp. RM]